VGGGSTSGIGASGGGTTGQRTTSRTATTGSGLAGASYNNQQNGNRGNTTGGNTGGNNFGINNQNNPNNAQQNFAQRLAGIIRSAGSTGDIQLIGPNKIIPDERMNALLVFASRDDMATIKDIISKLDVVLQQVLIEAAILDVTLGKNFNFGVSAAERAKAVGQNQYGGIANFGSSLNGGTSFLNNLIQNVSTNGGVTNITFSPNPTPSFPSTSGLSYFGSLAGSWDVAVNAIAGGDNAKVLARPRIQTSHNAPASIFVGETRPYITGTYFDGTSSGSRSQYSQTQIGISLTVTPLINAEGLVVMDIQQQVQQVGGTTTIDGNAVPITQDQNASAKVSVRTGDTIVMGGFIQNGKTDSQSGVPWLKDIPLLGALFRNTTTSSARRELLVLIRPTVLPTPEAAALQPDIERARLPIARQAEIDFDKEDAALIKRAAKNAKNAAEAEAKAEAKAAGKPEKKDTRDHLIPEDLK
jgi:general secretion pathway protein D